VVQFPAGPGEFALLQNVQNDSGGHTTCYSRGTRGSFHMCKTTWE